MSKPRKSSLASRSSRPTTTTQRWQSPVHVPPDTRSRSANLPATHERTALQKHRNQRARFCSTYLGCIALASYAHTQGSKTGTKWVALRLQLLHPETCAAESRTVISRKGTKND